MTTRPPGVTEHYLVGAFPAEQYVKVLFSSMFPEAKLGDSMQVHYLAE